MQKWEYCVVSGIGRSADHRRFDTHYPCFSRLTSNGVESVTDFKNRPRGVSEWDAVAQLIAQLGDEGWEMVGADAASLYFKRPKP
jgi:hypothetical protein